MFFLFSWRGICCFSSLEGNWRGNGLCGKDWHQMFPSPATGPVLRRQSDVCDPSGPQVARRDGNIWFNSLQFFQRFGFWGTSDCCNSLFVKFQDWDWNYLAGKNCGCSMCNQEFPQMDSFRQMSFWKNWMLTLVGLFTHKLTRLHWSDFFHYCIPIFSAVSFGVTLKRSMKHPGKVQDIVQK